MTSMLPLLLAVVLPVSTPALDERFAARHYVSDGKQIPVDAALDAFTLRADPRVPTTEIDGLVRAAAGKAGVAIDVASTSLARSHGLFLVELAQPLTREALVKLAASVEKDARVTAVYPVLTRMTGRAFADDHLVVTSEKGRLDEVLARVLPRVDGTVLRATRIPDTVLVAVGRGMARDAVEASRRLVGIVGLRSAEPELYREYALTATVNDPQHGAQWHLHRPAPNQPVPGVGQIFAHAAWDVTKGNADVVIAVFDSGMDVDHPDLAANVVGMFDPSDGDDDARPGCTDSGDGAGPVDSCPSTAPYRESHGTSVGGVIAAVADNNEGVSGVCPGCKLMAVRLLGQRVGSGLSTAESFERAVDEGAWIINNSWGPGRSRYFPMAMAERIAFDHARTAGRNGLGTVIVFAAGNSTANVASDPYASHPFSIAVAASSNLDDWAPYSNYGKEIDVAAPSLGGTVTEDNHGIVTTDVRGAEGYDTSSYTTEFSGTSAASPVVAGVAGLILSAFPGLTAEQVRLVLTRSADKIRADKIDWEQIFGQDIEELFAYDENGHSIGFGYGRVNAQRALEAAANPGLIGAPCDAPGCTGCGENNRCMVSCATQADCVDGSICTMGACELPHVGPGDIGAPCSSECEHCTTTIDTEGQQQSICTIECGADDDCPSGWDCRFIDTMGTGLCAVGNVHAGERNAVFNCRSDLYRSSILVSNARGEAFCTDICFDDAPGACPYGFHCAEARCVCVAEGFFGCATYTCTEDASLSNFDTPLCFPDENFGLACTDDTGCPPGDYCNAEGSCVPDDRAGCSICKDCERDEDCGAGNVCFASRDGTAVCTRGCYSDAYCPGDSVCRSVMRRNSVIQVCLSPDDGSGARCAAGYACTVACRDDVPCGDGKVCEEGVCVDAPPAVDAGVPGDGSSTDAGTQQPQGSGGDTNVTPAVTCSASTPHPAQGFPVMGALLVVVGALLRRRMR